MVDFFFQRTFLYESGSFFGNLIAVIKIDHKTNRSYIPGGYGASFGVVIEDNNNPVGNGSGKGGRKSPSRDGLGLKIS